MFTSVWTYDRQEAYTFAVYANAVNGVEQAKVIVKDEEDFGVLIVLHPLLSVEKGREAILELSKLICSFKWYGFICGSGIPFYSSQLGRLTCDLCQEVVGNHIIVQLFPDGKKMELVCDSCGEEEEED